MASGSPKITPKSKLHRFFEKKPEFWVYPGSLGLFSSLEPRRPRRGAVLFFNPGTWSSRLHSDPPGPSCPATTRSRLVGCSVLSAVALAKGEAGGAAPGLSSNAICVPMPSAWQDWQVLTGTCRMNRISAFSGGLVLCFAIFGE